MRVLPEATVHHLDGRGAVDKASALAAIAAALGLPEWFGGNLDALYDCLADQSWLPPGEHVLIWEHHDVLRLADPAAHRTILAVLHDAPAGRITVALVDG